MFYDDKQVHAAADAAMKVGRLECRVSAYARHDRAPAAADAGCRALPLTFITGGRRRRILRRAIAGFGAAFHFFYQQHRSTMTSSAEEKAAYFYAAR